MIVAGRDVGLERALAPPLPQHGGMISLFTPQFVGHPKEGAEEHGTVVVGEIDESRLHSQAAEFDQMARPFASLDLPIVHAGSRLRQFKPMPHGYQAPRHSLRRDHVAP